MKLTFSALALVLSSAYAFAPPAASSSGSATLLKAASGGVSEEFGIPCEDECALDQYPNLPPSVHPGVLSGEAMVDLLNHAKENGKPQIFLVLEAVDFSRAGRTKSFPVVLQKI